MRKMILRTLLLAVCTAALGIPVCHAQACPSTKTIPELVKALDDAVSGPGDKDRTCLKELMMSDARLIPVAKSPNGTWAPHPLTVEDWISRVAKRGSEKFYEVQVKYSVESYGQIAQLWSTFEIRPTPGGKPAARGINAIQAVNDGSGWKVSQIVWKDESPDDPIAARDLP
jgi:hypothetical protein